MGSLTTAAPRSHVLLCTEGTYPYAQGGVSVWCDSLVHELTEVGFQIFSVTSGPQSTPIFSLPPNVLGMQSLPLWGTDEVGLGTDSFVDVYRRKARTTSAVIEREFLSPFTNTLYEILRSSPDPKELGESFWQLHKYFQHYDYSKTMSSAPVWDTFGRECRIHFPGRGEPTAADIITCLRWIQRLLSILAVRFPRVSLTHSSMAGLGGIPGVLNKLSSGAPYLLTEHGIYLRELYLSLRSSGYTEACRHFLLAFSKSLVRVNYFYADAITSLGSFNKEWQINLGASRSKVHIVPNGLDPQRFYAPPRPHHDRPVVLTLARIYHLKGIDVLLRAASIVKTRVPSVLFRILGEVADPEYYRLCLELASALELTEHVEFAVTNNPANALADADVFCLPSISEGMPFCILEAMFTGCPVVATEVGNIPEMLAGTGILARPGNPESLARALISLLEGDARTYRDTLAHSARERALSSYTIQQVADRYRQFYRDLVHDNASNSEMYRTASV